MRIEGNGGGIYAAPALDLLKGVSTTDAEYTSAGFCQPDEVVCANPKCRKLFYPRQEGDDYCCEACSADSNPNWKGGIRHD